MNDAVRRPDDDLPIHPRGQASDAELLAEFSIDLREEVDLPRDVARHVAACADCRSILDVLLAVGAELRAAAPPMPAAVSQRLAAALGELRSDAGVRSGRHRATATDELATSWRRRRLRAVGSVAAGLIMLGGGGYLVVTGADSVVSGGGDSAENGAGGEALSADEDSGLPAYNRESLRAAVGDILLTGLARAEEEGVDASTTEGVPDTVTAVEPECLASLPVATGAALSITRALYDGQPAIVVLFAAESGQVQVTVLSDCSAGEPTVLDQFEADR